MKWFKRKHRHVWGPWRPATATTVFPFAQQRQCQDKACQFMQMNMMKVL